MTAAEHTNTGSTFYHLKSGGRWGEKDTGDEKRRAQPCSGRLPRLRDLRRAHPNPMRMVNRVLLQHLGLARAGRNNHQLFNGKRLLAPPHRLQLETAVVIKELLMAAVFPQPLVNDIPGPPQLSHALVGQEVVQRSGIVIAGARKFAQVMKLHTGSSTRAPCTVARKQR